MKQQWNVILILSICVVLMGATAIAAGAVDSSTESFVSESSSSLSSENEGKLTSDDQSASGSEVTDPSSVSDPSSESSSFESDIGTESEQSDGTESSQTTSSSSNFESSNRVDSYVEVENSEPVASASGNENQGYKGYNQKIKEKAAFSGKDEPITTEQDNNKKSNGDSGKLFSSQPSGENRSIKVWTTVSAVLCVLTLSLLVVVNVHYNKRYRSIDPDVKLKKEMKSKKKKENRKKKTVYKKPKA